MSTFLADYECSDCGCVFEALKHNNSIIECPRCKSIKLDQIMGGHSTKLHDPEVLKNTLKRRSQEHSLQEMRKQAGWKTGALPPHLCSRPK
jgi:DNA-directed RNA polymerase subunit RPC12/RpoP